MEKFFNGVLRVLAGICAILFVLTAGVALMAFNAERRLFNAQLYLRAFDEQRLYDQIPALATDVLTAADNLNPCTNNPIACGQEARSTEAQSCFETALGAETYRILVRNERAPTTEELARAQTCFERFGRSEMGQGFGPPEYLKTLSAEDLQTIIGAILPPEITRTLIENAITSVFGYLNGETESATLSMTAFKTHLSGPSGILATMQLLTAQPPCTLEEIAQMLLSNLVGEPNLILCNPSEEMLTSLQPLIQLELQTVAAGIPDTVTLIPAEAQDMQNPLTALRVARILLRLSPLIPLGLLFLITVFAVRSLKGWFYWWGFPLFISGALGLMLSAAVHPIFQWSFKTYLVPRFPPGLPVSVTDVSRNLMSTVLTGVAVPIVIQSLVLLLIGIVLVLAARLKISAKSPSRPQDTEGEIPE